MKETQINGFEMRKDISLHNKPPVVCTNKTRRNRDLTPPKDYWVRIQNNPISLYDVFKDFLLGIKRRCCL